MNSKPIGKRMIISINLGIWLDWNDIDGIINLNLGGV